MPYVDLHSSETAVILTQTVRDNYDGFTKREVKDAKLARKLQGMVAHPSERTFHNMVSENLIKDCPVKLKAATDSDVIFGPEQAGHQGKEVRQKPQRVEVEYVAIPRDIYSLHRFVTLTADIMFVN